MSPAWYKEITRSFNNSRKFLEEETQAQVGLLTSNAIKSYKPTMCKVYSYTSISFQPHKPPFSFISDEDSKAQNGRVTHLRSDLEPKASVLVLNLHVSVSWASSRYVQLHFLLDEGKLC